MSNRQLPDHIPGTVKDWRIRKRREWDAVIKAFDVYRIGCAYAPVKTSEIYHLLSDGQRQLRGRWKP